jgi:hypothetical protein
MYRLLLEGGLIVGLLLGFNGVVRLAVRKKTGAWKGRVAAAVARGVIGWVSLFVLYGVGSLGRHEGPGLGPLFVLLMAGLVLVFDRVVRWCVRNKTGKWKEGGASLLAGVIITGVSLVVAVWCSGTSSGIWFSTLPVPGLVLAFNGAVQLSVGKKTGAWAEGGASLLAGAIIVGAISFWMVPDMWGVALLVNLLFCCSVAGLVVAVNGVGGPR